jgi:Tfp pilus assembly protein PilV
MNRYLKDNRLQRGQSLFEVVVAIAISALIVTAVVALATNSIQNSSFSRDKTIATNYVQETMEWLKQERDQNSDIFNVKAEFSRSSDVTYCLDSLSWPVVPKSCTSDEVVVGTNFIRELTFPSCADPCPVDIVEAKVTVYWIDSKGVHEVTSSTNLSLK